MADRQVLKALIRGLAGFETPLNKLGLDHLDVYGQWRAMEALNREGVAKGIGVANFYPDRLIDLNVNNEIVPAVNQIETHPFFQRADYQDLMRQHGVQIQSWGGFAEGRNDLFTTPLLAEIGKEYGKSVAQVVLRRLSQRGVVAIPKSVRPERMAENADVFDFQLGRLIRSRPPLPCHSRPRCGGGLAAREVGAVIAGQDQCGRSAMI